MYIQVADGAEAKRRLDKNQVKLVEDVTPIALMDELISRHVMEDPDTEERVRAVKRNEGPRAATRELLTYLKNVVMKSPDKFQEIVESLKATEQDDLAGQLCRPVPPAIVDGRNLYM